MMLFVLGRMYDVMNQVFKLAEEKKTILYSDPDSIQKELDTFLNEHDFYQSLNNAMFRKCLHGHNELFDGLLKLYYKAKYENEKIALLEDLAAIGCNKDILVKLILEVFDSDNQNIYLWEYGDLLYCIKNFRFMDQYLKIISNKSLGSDRQMVILLVGKSKIPEAIPVLKELLSDETVYGHALDALSHYKGSDILEIMNLYKNCKVKWIRDIALKYIKKSKK